MIDVTAMVDALLGEHCADCTSECCTRCVADYRLAGLLGEVGAAYGAGATISLIGDRHPAVMATLTPSQRRAAA